MQPEIPRVLVLANQKGGVGKTTTAINLGTALAAIGERVLIIDLDPQGNASTGLGVAQKDRAKSSYDVLVGDITLREAIRETVVPNLHIVPSRVDLSGFELEFAREQDRTYRLRTALQALNRISILPLSAQAAEERSFDVVWDAGEHDDAASRIPQSNAADHIALGANSFSYVLIDCPPSLNLVTVNAMAAANAVLVPLQCEFFALEGLSQLLKTVEQVRASLNPKLTIHGIVLTMYDARNKLAGQVVTDVRAFMGDKVYQTVIPRNVRVSEAPSHGKPVLLYDLKCIGSQAYIRLASEVIQREKALRAAA
jgi:chromosome partitioning protein